MKEQKNAKKSPERPICNEKREKDTEFDVFYGRHTIDQLLESKKRIKVLYFQKGEKRGDFQDILKSAGQAGVKMTATNKKHLDELTNNANHQGLVAIAEAYKYSDLETCFALAEEREEAPFFVILDQLEDPHNLGSILRTAEATGVHGVILPKHRSVGLTATVAKVSTGSINRVPVVQVTNLSRTIKKLQERGVWVFATAMDGVDMRKWNSQGPIAIVIGNEGKGVSDSVIKASDGLVSVPMTGEVESLNAGVAAAVLLYEIARDRLPITSLGY